MEIGPSTAIWALACFGAVFVAWIFETTLRTTCSWIALYAQILTEKALRAARRRPATQPTTPMESRYHQ